MPMIAMEKEIPMIEEVNIPATREIEADGFITPPSALEHIEKPNTSMTGNATARPMRDCLYPKCEECDCYHGHYCTVPMVINKQIYLYITDELFNVGYKLEKLEELIFDLILEPKRKEGTTETNLTWADYFQEEEK